MPELPEVETVVRGLDPFLSGKMLKDIKTYRADLRMPFPVKLSDLQGQKILRLSRRAKYILIHFSEEILVVHLGMSGRMIVHHDMAEYKPEKHDHMVITMKDGCGVVFNDPRRFGMVLLVNKDTLASHKAFDKLGPEPLSEDFDGKILHEAIIRKNTPIKSALLDQHIVAGIGNIYACEALFAAGIDPTKKSSAITSKKAGDLAKAIKDVLKRAIAAGGSSLKDYRKADGELGYFQHSFLVYDREGETCPRCNKNGKTKPVILRITQSGRSTFYCPACQR